MSDICKDRGYHSYDFADATIEEESDESMTIVMQCKDCNCQGTGTIDWEDKGEDEEDDEDE